jgi:hypothetical protein
VKGGGGGGRGERGERVRGCVWRERETETERERLQDTTSHQVITHT